MWKRLLIWLLNKVVESGGVNLYTASEPRGRKIGGHDIPEVKDRYIILVVLWGGQEVWACHWQTS